MKYRIYYYETIEYIPGSGMVHMYHATVQVKGSLWWHDVCHIDDQIDEYVRNRAEEIVDILERA